MDEPLRFVHFCTKTVSISEQPYNIGLGGACEARSRSTGGNSMASFMFVDPSGQDYQRQHAQLFGLRTGREAALA